MSGLLATLQFVGGGTAFVELRNLGNGQYRAASVGYSFAAIQTPEPATLILFGSGVLGIIGARYRKRGQS